MKTKSVGDMVHSRVHSSQTTFESSVAFVRTNCPGWQSPTASHALLTEGVGARDSYSVARQVVRFLHTRFEIAVGAMGSYSHISHTVSEAHSRLEYRVGATVSYMVRRPSKLQSSIVEQFRSEVGVFRVEIHSVAAPHTVNSPHSRSVKLVGAAVSNL